MHVLLGVNMAGSTLWFPWSSPRFEFLCSESKCALNITPDSRAGCYLAAEVVEDSHMIMGALLWACGGTLFFCDRMHDPVKHRCASYKPAARACLILSRRVLFVRARGAQATSLAGPSDAAARGVAYGMLPRCRFSLRNDKCREFILRRGGRTLFLFQSSSV